MANKTELRAVLTAVDKMSGPLKNIVRGSQLAHKSLRDIGNAGGELMRKIGLPAIASFTAVTYAALNAGKASLEYAGNIQDAADRTGAGVENYQVLSNMLGLVGASAEDSEALITKFNKGTSEAAAGVDKNFAGLMKKLKIPLKSANGDIISLTDALPDLADAFAANKDPALQTRMVMELFGKSGTKMLPILNKGREGVKAWIAEQSRLGAVVKEESVGALDDLGDSLATVQTQVKAMQTNAFAKLVPALKPIVDSMKEWLVVNQEWLQAEIVSTITDISNALKDVNWKEVIKDLKETFAMIVSVVNALGGLKGVVIGMGLAFIAGPIAAVLTIAGSVLRFGSALVMMLGGWSAIGAVIMRVVGIGRVFVSVLMLVGKAIFLIGRAILMNPIGLAITALVAGAYLVYKNWDKIKVWWQSFSTWIGGIVTDIAKKLTNLMPDWVKNMFTGSSISVMGAPSNVNSAGNKSNILGANKLNGEMTVRFENAPQGLRAGQGKTNQAGVGMNADVGYNPLAAFSL